MNQTCKDELSITKKPDNTRKKLKNLSTFKFLFSEILASVNEQV